MRAASRWSVNSVWQNGWISQRSLPARSACRFAAAFADELDRWFEGRPVIARPVSLPARGYRWSRRNSVLATSLAVCLFFAAAVITRQVQTWKLENKVRENELVRNSVV